MLPEVIPQPQNPVPVWSCDKLAGTKFVARKFAVHPPSKALRSSLLLCFRRSADLFGKLTTESGHQLAQSRGDRARVAARSRARPL
jgi:hypothetical protein